MNVVNVLVVPITIRAAMGLIPLVNPKQLRDIIGRKRDGRGTLQVVAHQCVPIQTGMRFAAL